MIDLSPPSGHPSASFRSEFCDVAIFADIVSLMDRSVAALRSPFRLLQVRIVRKKDTGIVWALKSMTKDAMVVKNQARGRGPPPFLMKKTLHQPSTYNQTTDGLFPDRSQSQSTTRFHGGDTKYIYIILRITCLYLFVLFIAAIGWFHTSHRS